MSVVSKGELNTRYTLQAQSKKGSPHLSYIEETFNNKGLWTACGLKDDTVL